MFDSIQDTTIRSDAVLYNAVISSLCKRGKTDRAIDFFAYMVSSGCMPNEWIYTILIRGLATDGFVKEAQELLSELCSRGALRKHLMRHFGIA
uniref:Pentatricopeptide repeat-containing protein n=1 Tax=Arundo donax TaxID=35708 RepID=A0A0A9GJP3_ARUDO